MSNELDMPLDEFAPAGARALEWIARYLSQPENYPVMSQVAPGELKAALPDSAPRIGEPIDVILDDFERLILPGITHWNHPNFFAYFAISGSAAGILGELLSATLNINGMLWQTSPAATELEEVVVDWLRRLIGLPEEFKGVIMDTASVSTVCAIAAARHAQSDLEVRDKGTAGRAEVPRLRLYTSEHAHSSVEKAAILLGLGRENVRKISTDKDFRLSVRTLNSAIEDDTAAGYRPFCVSATVGTTSTTSIDPVPEIAAICKRHNLWLHVDAAYAGSAALIPEHRHIMKGCEAADSFVINPHKWLFTPIDCSVLYLQRPDQFTDAFSLVPEYLRTGASDSATNYMDWGIALGRRFRALKLWMVLRYFGSDRIAEILSRHMELAQLLAGWIDAHPDFERLAPVPFSLVCFRAKPSRLLEKVASPDEAGEATEKIIGRFNQELLGRLNASGRMYLSHTRLNGRYTLRFAIGNLRTTEKNVEDAWRLIESECQSLDIDFSLNLG